MTAAADHPVHQQVSATIVQFCLTVKVLDLHRLRTFREFATRGTIAAVADALGYSASAVSQQLAALEREAGAALTRRAGRHLVLTPAGRDLADRADALLAHAERTQAALRAGTATPSGTVRLAVFQSAALALLPRALPALRIAAPGVRVEVIQSEPAQALKDTWSRDFDVVVAEEYPHHAAPHQPGLARETLVEDPISLAVPAGRPGDLRAQAAAAWVMEPPGTASRHFAEQACRRAGFEPDARFETADLQAHVALVAAGVAVALVPGLMWESGIPSTIDRRAVPGSPLRTVFAAYRAASAGDPAVAVTLTELRNAASLLTVT